MGLKIFRTNLSNLKAFVGKDDECGPHLLLRPQSLNPSGREFGQPVGRLPVSWTFITLFLLIVGVTSIALMSVGSYARVETVRGVLQPTSGNVQMFPTDRAIVKRVLVNEGDVVQAGDLLTTFSTERPGLSGNNTQAEMLTDLEAQERSILQRRSAIQHDGDLDDSASKAQLQSLSASSIAARADLASIKEQLEMAADDYDRAREIALRGFVSGSDLRRRRQNVLVLRGSKADALARIANLNGQIAQLKAVAAKRPFDSLKEQGLLDDMIAEIRQRRVQYSLSGGFAIRAPVSGTVTAIQASVGRLADPQHPVLSIIPVHAAMKAVLYAPSRAVGFLRPGQHVRIRYDAFPYQSVGSASGVISFVSHTILRPEEVDAAIRVEEPSYQIVVRLDRQFVPAYGKRHILFPGMALTADIILERRTLLHWILQPLYAASSVSL
jgi:membrane fusion protein